MDAALAANIALTVVEPMMSGMGGDLFAISRDAGTGKLSGINASGWAPRRLSLELLKERGIDSMPQQGILSVSVPGCVDGWEQLHKKHGRLPWAELFKPAIYYAEHGFPVTELIQQHWVDAVAKLSAEDYSRKVFLRDGKPPRLGEVFRNPDLAKALRLVAKEGARAFYRGAIADAILATSRRLGGVLEADDLSEFSSEWVEPIATDYRGWKVWELPPSGQGMAALAMLNIMERFPLGSYAPLSADAYHVKIEAQKLAYQDLKRYLADPRFARVPVDGLISKAYAAKRAALVRMDRANCETAAGDPGSGAGDTVYLTAVDKDGNVVSLIQSIYLSFGAGVAVDGYGFHLHNRAGLFEMDAGHPNALAPRKRPFHTIIPALMENEGRYVGFGIMGGLNQALAHAQFVSNIVDHGMNLQAALEAPRFTKLNYGGCDLLIEGRVPPETRQALTARGHQLDVRGDYALLVGGGQAVMHDSRAKVNYGASSPRKDGAAIPEPDPYF